jgi:hypothetical protein
MTKDQYKEQIDLFFQAAYAAICNCHEHVHAFPCECEDSERVQKSMDVLIEARRVALKNYESLTDSKRYANF